MSLSSSCFIIAFLFNVSLLLLAYCTPSILTFLSNGSTFFLLQEIAPFQFFIYICFPIIIGFTLISSASVMPNTFTCIQTLESFECEVVDSQIFLTHVQVEYSCWDSFQHCGLAVPTNRVNIQTLTFPSRAVFSLRFHFFNYTVY